MTPARFRLLAALALLSVASAGWAIASRPPVVSAAADRGLAFPDLHGRIGAVAEIRIEGGGGAVTLRRMDAGWIYVEHAGYPADPQKIGRFVGALAALRFVEEKTARPESYARLQLEEPGPQAKSRRVTVSDADGKPVAALILGRLSWTLGTRGQTGTYLRLPQGDRAWLALGKVETPDPPLDWMNRTLIDLSDRLIRSIDYTRGAERLYTISRNTQGPFGFTVSPAPPGGADANKVNPRAAILSGLTFEQAAPAAGVTIPPDALTLTVRSDPGITVTIAQFRHDNAYWAKIGVALDEAALKGWAAAYKPDAERSQPYDGDPEGAMRKTYAAARAATDGWIFRLADHKTDQIKTTGVGDFAKTN